MRFLLSIIFVLFLSFGCATAQEVKKPDLINFELKDHQPLFRVDGDGCIYGLDNRSVGELTEQEAKLMRLILEEYTQQPDS